MYKQRIGRWLLSLLLIHVNAFALDPTYFDADAGLTTISKEELNSIPFYLKNSATNDGSKTNTTSPIFTGHTLELAEAFKKAMVNNVSVNNNTLFVADWRLAQCSQNIKLILNKADDLEVPYPQYPIRYNGTSLITTAHVKGFIGVKFSKAVNDQDDDVSLTVDSDGEQIFDIVLSPSDYDLFISSQEVLSAEKTSALAKKLLDKFEARAQENLKQCQIALKYWADFERIALNSKTSPQRMEYQEELIVGPKGRSHSKPVEVGHAISAKK